MFADVMDVAWHSGDILWQHGIEEEPDAEQFHTVPGGTAAPGRPLCSHPLRFSVGMAYQQKRKRVELKRQSVYDKI